MDEDTKKCVCGADCAGEAVCPACGEAGPNTVAAEAGADTEEEVEAADPLADADEEAV